MITTKLIIREEIQQYKQISKSIHNDKLNQLILEAQYNDLRPLLGDNFYLKMLDEIEDGSIVYNELLDGSVYNYNSIDYKNVGLKAVLSSYIYARLMMFGDVINTPFGNVIKENDSSSKPDTSVKKTFYQMNRNEAYNLWLNVERFMVRTSFTGYKSCRKNKNTFKISKAG